MLQKQDGNLVAAADGVILDGLDDLKQELSVLHAWEYNGGLQGIVSEHVPHKASVDVEPDLRPGIILIGSIMLVGIGPQNIGVPCVDLVGSVVLLDIAPSAEDVFEYVKIVAMDPFDLIISVDIADPGHVRREAGVLLSNEDRLLFVCMLVDILFHFGISPAAYLGCFGHE